MTHEKIKEISDWPYPGSPKEMRSFVGLSGAYHKFVPDFAKISAPLMELVSMEQGRSHPAACYRQLGIPDSLRQEILQEAHDSPIGGHFGAQRTTALVQMEFY